MKKTDQSLEIMRSMKEIMSEIRQHMKSAYKDIGITAPQGYLLGMLSKTGKMKVHELGEKLSMTDSTVSGIVDRLEKSGMVKRTRSLNDKRVVYVEITRKFRSTHSDFHRIMDSSVTDIISSGTPQELEAVTNGLRIMKKLLSKSFLDKKKPENGRS